MILAIVDGDHAALMARGGRLSIFARDAKDEITRSALRTQDVFSFPVLRKMRLTGCRPGDAFIRSAIERVRCVCGLAETTNGLLTCADGSRSVFEHGVPGLCRAFLLFAPLY